MAENVTMHDDGSVDVAHDNAAKQPIMASETLNFAAVLESEGEARYPSYRNPQNMLTGPELLDEMGQVVAEEYDVDESSRTQWKTNLANDLKLFSSFMGEKTFPWKDASNVNVPMMSISTIQFHARAVPSLLPPKEVVRTFPTGHEDINKADRVQKYMNYQLLYEMDEFEEGMDKSLLQVPIQGSVFRKSYYDPILRRPTSQYVSAMDFVVNYGTRRLEDARRATHTLLLTRSDIIKRAQQGIFSASAAEFNLAGAFSAEAHGGEIREMVDKINGIQPTSDAGSDIHGPRLVLEQHRGWDFEGTGIEKPYVITVDYETKKVLKITDRSWLNPVTQEKETINYFTHYEFIPNPEGFYGLGFGTLLRGLNESANTIINEVIDAGALANIQGGFVSKRSAVSKGAITFKMGEYKEFDGYVDDIRKAIYSFDFKGPNNTLFSTLGLIFEYSRQVSAVSETMTGQMPASDTPASTVLALIEEGRKVFSTIHKRLHRAFKKELKKIYRLNSIFLDIDKYFNVLGENNMPDPQSREKVGRADFLNIRDVVPVSDPEIVSRTERVLKAQQVWELTMSSPVTAQNEAAIRAAQLRLYKSLDIENPEELMPPPPEPPNLSPEEENANLLMQKPATALPQQSHQHHLVVHEDLAEGAFADQLTPEGKKLLEQHMREHVGLLYLVSQAQAKQAAQIGNA